MLQNLNKKNLNKKVRNPTESNHRNTRRHTNNLQHISNWQGIPILFTTAHWLVYFNSAFNPVIYNFMSAKFKKEFRSVFRCSRVERSKLLHESTYAHGKLRVQPRIPLTQSTELDHNGSQHF
ncbi:hypothetical protein ACOMHN_052768 [Nucella lapillus]